MNPKPLVFSELTGVQKAAIFLMAMGENVTKNIFTQMSNDEVRDISLAMASLGKVDAHLVEQVLNEYSSRLTAPSSVTGTFEITEKFLSQVLPPERRAEIIGEMQGPAGRTIWDKLQNVNEEILADYLKNEYPQTVAVILARLSPEYAAKVMAYLPDGFVMDVIMRLLHLEKVQKEVLDEIEQTIKDDFMSTLTASEVQDSSERVAGIFNCLDRHTENRLMTGLFERNREVAENIRSQMFTFEDLVHLSGESLQKILRAVDRKKIALALKGASESLKGVFLENMSENASLMLMEDMDALGAVRLKDVDAAQSLIIDMARKMVQSGEIEILGETDENEEMIN
ncbi:MAG: flagellar motor switch protein FliG [Alphaproteobacteria bacterium]|nr:flagellar motor switch protein FliG [Alphaproteobacteria bacterium]